MSITRLLLKIMVGSTDTSQQIAPFEDLTNENNNR